MSQARSWLGTLNNPDTTVVQDYLSLWFTKARARYVNGQLEKGKEGTVHIQFFLNFEKPVRLAALKKFCPKAHFQQVLRDNGASDYCLKEETRLEGPWEFGLKPARHNVQGEKALKNKTILELGVEKCVEMELISIKDYCKIKQCVQQYNLNTQKAMDADDVRGVWYWGDPGAGKSYNARLRYPDAYLKAQNKWWDGYTGQ